MKNTKLKLKIEKNIPVRRGFYAVAKQAALKMKPGDSLMVKSIKEANVLRVVIYKIGERAKIRRQKKGWRVWKVKK